MSAPRRTLLLGVTVALALVGLVIPRSAQAAEPVPPLTLEGDITVLTDHPIDGYVEILRWSGTEFEQVQSEFVTGTSGYSARPLLAGHYTVRYVDATGRFHPTFGNGGLTAPAGPAAPGVVEVTDLEGARLDVTLVPIQVTVSGRLVSEANQPLANITVEAWERPSVVVTRKVASFSSRADGSFEFTLIPSDYFFRIQETAELNEVFIERQIGAADVDLGDVVVVMPPRFDVTGVVRDTSGAPVVGANVLLFEERSGQRQRTRDPIVTDVDGRYTFDDLKADRSYTVAAVKAGYRYTVLGGGEDPAHGDLFVPAQGLELAAIVLPSLQSAVGRLVGPSGNPLQGGTVTAYVGAVSGSSVTWSVHASADTDALGRYVVPIPESSLLTFKFSHPTHVEQFLGGGTALPTTPTPENSRTSGTQAQGNLELGDTSMATPSGSGTVVGRVVRDGDGAPVSGAWVTLCGPGGANCSTSQTDADGEFGFDDLAPGTYQVVVRAEDVNLLEGRASITVSAGMTTQVPEIRLATADPMPAGATIDGQNEGGVPSVVYTEPFELKVTGCAGVANPTYTITMADGRQVRTGTFAQAPPGTYTATVPALAPDAGLARVVTNIPAACGDDPVEFNLYIDPSGIVTDQYGRPLQGATVTLLRSDTEGGTYVTVPDGSPVMSPSNRNNPSTADAKGYFRWDVTPGWYKVRAEKSGCATATTDAMQVPPERIDLVVKLTCSGAAPTPATAPSVSGLPQVGRTITAQPATWPAPLVNESVQLLRNGTPLQTTSHTLTAVDVGAVFRARSVGRRPTYVTEGGAGAAVTFTPATVESDPVTGVDVDEIVGMVAPPTGSGKVGTPLVAAAPVWNTEDVQATRTWTRDGAPIAGATGQSYEVVPADVGTSIRVMYTGTKQGWKPGSAISAPVAGKLGDAPAGTVGPPVGSAKVGTTLTAATPTWSVPGVAVARQWLRGGAPIPGAAGATYLVTPDDLGRSISVRYVATKAGYHDAEITSVAVTGAAGDAALAETPPTISGAARAGATLTADPGAWDAQGLTFTYQWRVIGLDIPGATGRTYVVPPQLSGYPVRVEVTASRTGYASGRAESAGRTIDKLPSSVDADLVKRAIRPGGRAVVDVDVDVPGIASPIGTVAVLKGTRVLTHQRLFAADRGDRRIRLPLLGPGRHRLVVYFGASTSAEASLSRRLVLTVRR